MSESHSNVLCRSQIKPDAGDVARISALEKDIASFTKELEKLQQRAGTIETDITTLERKILEVGGSRMLGQKSKVDGIKLHIDLANDEMTKAEIAKAKAEKDTVKLANAIKNNKATLEELQEELEGLNQQYEECTEYVEEIRAQVEVAQTAAENSKDDLEALKAQLDEKTEEIQAFRQKEVCHKVSLILPLRELMFFLRWHSSRNLLTSRRNLQRTLRLWNVGLKNMTSSDCRILSKSFFIMVICTGMLNHP